MVQRHNWVASMNVNSTSKSVMLKKREEQSLRKIMRVQTPAKYKMVHKDAAGKEVVEHIEEEQVSEVGL